jgi:L-threonylcarbamoyladenylate synthase
MSGGLVVIPTETVYGLVANASLEGAADKIYAAKERERGKPLQLLISGAEVVAEMGFHLNAVEKRLAEAFWPGGLTLVVSNADGLSEGFRVPDSELALAVLRNVGGALRSTSANLSGMPAALTADEAVACIGASVDIVIDGGRVDGGIASTVVRVDETGNIDILREGALSKADIFAAGN